MSTAEASPTPLPPPATRSGVVFDIQRFCHHDGPGIRTTVFLKGCPLRCVWCHNPESQRRTGQLVFSPNLCIDCRQCEKVADGPVRERLATRARTGDGCTDLRACADACPTGAIRHSGSRATVDAVLAEVERDRVFYEVSGGGMTLSGGEPLAQWAFARALLREARDRGISTCVETAGAGTREDVVELAGLADLVLWDLKDIDPDRHLRLTGAPLEPCLANLHALDAVGGRFIVRLIMVAELNCDDARFEATAQLLAGLRGVRAVELVPYHPLGEAKRDSLGLPATSTFTSPDSAALAHAAAILTGRGLDVIANA